MASKATLSTRRQLQLMQQLQELADNRAQSEIAIAETLQSEMTAARQAYETTEQELVDEYTGRRRNLENEFSQAKIEASEQLRQAQQELLTEYEKKQADAQSEYKQTALAIDRKRKESEWQAMAVYDAAKDKPQQDFSQACKKLHHRRLQVDGLRRDAHTLMAMRHLDQRAHSQVEQSAEEPLAPGTSADDEHQAACHALHQAVLDLQAQPLPSLLLEGFRPIGWWIGSIVFTLVVAIPLLGGLEWSLWLSPLLALLLGTALAWVGYWFLGRRAQQQSLAKYEEISRLLARIARLEKAARDAAQAESQESARAIALQKHQELTRAKEIGEKESAANLQRRDTALDAARSHYEAELKQVTAFHDQSIAAADEKYPPMLDSLAAERLEKLEENRQRFQQRTKKAEQAHETAWEAMASRWRSGYQAVFDELAAMRSVCQRYFPDWASTDWHDWDRPGEAPPAIQFGTCHLPLQMVKNCLSADERLHPPEKQLEIPTLVPFNELPHLVISAHGAGRAAAVELIQAMMLRYLTAMPAGRLRFTLIDPTAMGENFASFMHLADFDEQLIGGRILTDQRQIDERLTMLSDHMEKVLQKYLRNEFESLEEYNVHAGEVAEPYHVLVLANFPAGLSDASMRRLLKIATTGPKCGVYTLMSIDTAQKMPADMPLDDLLAEAVHLAWVDDRLKWQYPLYNRLKLELDRVPPRDRLNDLLRITGQESREASRVEVPFEVVAPRNLWTEDSSYELAIPMGRAGANEVQALRLGRGTSQHALVSGKTGSGKSTMLHALVTNAALHYSPDELEFYLVDFKKGVEFKAYATGQLPHARVIAIESEREFGVSVLERLDEELRRRGERFRQLGVQDLAGYRAACDEPLPRVLLIIDEFQELFVADDKLAQDAALLLDRLVRQGRAFGMHVLLGSQTLAGAYSLARSTLGQMAVRIALECSDADCHLILSDENSAARLLSRPGEAIYNDQNGTVAGNNLFQVVWLPDAKRKEYLAQIRARTSANELTPAPAIVFEGNVPADPQANPALVSLIENSGEATETTEPTIWLGSAVRIEPPTQLTFRRQGGNHLMIVGQDEPLALGILTNALIALVAQFRGIEARFVVLDGTRPESPERGTWEEVVQALPDSVRVFGPRDTAKTIAALNEEVERRGSDDQSPHPPCFLIIHDLAQFRDLRVSEDEFSFSSLKSNGKSPAVDSQFRTLLKEGPAVGVHVLLWGDSYNTLSRSIDRLALREIDYRVALQMSSGDSTSLIESPAASRLGEHRALVYRDDLGTHSKFRPYGRPTGEWLAWVAGQKSAVGGRRSEVEIPK